MFTEARVLTDGYLRFFPGYLRWFPGKIWLQNPWSAKMPKVVQLWSFGEKPLKKHHKAEISQTSIYLCFFEDTGVYVYIYNMFLQHIFEQMIICVLRFRYTQSVLVLGSKFNFTSSEPRRNRSRKGSPSFGFCCRLLAKFELSQCTWHSNLLSHRGFWDRGRGFQSWWTPFWLAA